MRKILILAIVFNSLLWSANAETEKEKRLKKQIEIEIERDKKFAREQTFYKGKDYNLSGSEVNKETVESIEEIEPLEFDMDSVYD
ncbi:MAG TPA: hypothetical protein EYH01_02685 [Campylobacterales bacterium]|nr:hypothetical protein [Campylobacterales bacterium]